MDDESQTETPRVGLDEGVTARCVCGWWGWIHPSAYESPATVERDCPDCRRTLRATVEVEIVD